MKRTFSIFIVLLLVVFASCKTNKMTGLYVCDDSRKKTNTVTERNEVVVDFTCAIQSIEFVGDSTVKIKLQGGLIVATYEMDNEYVRVKNNGSIILFKIQDNKTLKGEGPFDGLYHKK